MTLTLAKGAENLLSDLLQIEILSYFAYFLLDLYTVIDIQCSSGCTIRGTLLLPYYMSMHTFQLLKGVRNLLSKLRYFFW